jgi:small-conductance mechanosensitive channel
MMNVAANIRRLVELQNINITALKNEVSAVWVEYHEMVEMKDAEIAGLKESVQRQEDQVRTWKQIIDSANEFALKNGQMVIDRDVEIAALKERVRELEGKIKKLTPPAPTDNQRTYYGIDPGSLSD